MLLNGTRCKSTGRSNYNLINNANEKLYFRQQAQIQYATSSLTKYTYYYCLHIMFNLYDSKLRELKNIVKMDQYPLGTRHPRGGNKQLVYPGIAMHLLASLMKSLYHLSCKQVKPGRNSERLYQKTIIWWSDNYDNKITVTMGYIHVLRALNCPKRQTVLVRITRVILGYPGWNKKAHTRTSWQTNALYLWVWHFKVYQLQLG